MLPDTDYRQTPRSELVWEIVRYLSRDVSPLVLAMSGIKENIRAEAERIADAMQNPPTEGENDGERG